MTFQKQCWGRNDNLVRLLVFQDKKSNLANKSNALYTICLTAWTTSELFSLSQQNVLILLEDKIHW